MQLLGPIIRSFTYSMSFKVPTICTGFGDPIYDGEQNLVPAFLKMTVL